MRFVSASSEQSAWVLDRSALRDFALHHWAKMSGNNGIWKAVRAKVRTHHCVVGQGFGSLLINGIIRPHSDAYCHPSY